MFNAKPTWGQTQYEIVIEFTKFTILRTIYHFARISSEFLSNQNAQVFIEFCLVWHFLKKNVVVFLTANNFPCQITMFRFRFRHLRDTFSDLQEKSRFHRIVNTIVHRYIEQQSKAPTCSFIFGPKCTNFIGICAIFHSSGPANRVWVDSYQPFSISFPPFIIYSVCARNFARGIHDDV